MRMIVALTMLAGCAFYQTPCGSRGNLVARIDRKFAMSCKSHARVTSTAPPSPAALLSRSVAELGQADT